MEAGGSPELAQGWNQKAVRGPRTSQRIQKSKKRVEAPQWKNELPMDYKSNGARLNLNRSSQRGDSAAYNTLSRV